MRDQMKQLKVEETCIAEFYNFYTSYDVRRNKDFNKVFPEFTRFYQKCKRVANG